MIDKKLVLLASIAKYGGEAVIGTVMLIKCISKFKNL